MPTIDVIIAAHKEAVRRALRDHQEKAMSKKPDYMYSRLTLAGSDDVDELLRLCKGDKQQAESILHAMLNNYLHFNQMHREKDLGALHRLQVEKRQRETTLSEALRHHDIHPSDALVLTRKLQELEGDIQKLIDKLEEKAERPVRQGVFS